MNTAHVIGCPRLRSTVIGDVGTDGCTCSVVTVSSMSFNEYQTATAKYDTAPASNRDMHYALGLGGESGEVLEKIKKANRAEGYRTPADPKQMASELGDVLWYLARLAAVYGFTLQEVAQINLDKLESRQQRGVLGGNGDNR